MKNRSPVVGLAAAAILAFGGAAFAHHSLSGQFDVQRSVHVRGTVSRVDWMNPHVYVYVDVKDKTGAVTTWRFESLPVAMMRKAGLSKNELFDEGRPLDIDAYPARNGTPNLGYLLHLKFQSGRYIAFNEVPGAQPPP
jgi:hypothetical protein